MGDFMKEKKVYFEICIEEARQSLLHGDVPIGAIIVHNNEIIAQSHNTRERDKNIMGHAEINAINEASKVLNRWNLSDCDLYVTLAPCSMCNEVIKQSRIANVYYLLSKPDSKKEYNRTNFCNFNEKIAQNYIQMYACMLSEFFKSKRV